MGDGSLSANTRGSSGTRFRMGHGAKQGPYLDWKAGMLGNIGQSRRTPNGAVFVDLTPLPELAELREAVYLAGGQKPSGDYLKALTPLALAIWYMDDGVVHRAVQGPAGAHRGRAAAGSSSASRR